MNDGADMEVTPERTELACIHPEHVRPLRGRVVPMRAAAELAAMFEVLADPTRARLLHALSLAEEICVCDLAALLGRSASTLSHQLRLLRDRGVVDRRREGRVVYYRLADDHIRHVLVDGLQHITEEPRAGEKATS